MTERAIKRELSPGTGALGAVLGLACTMAALSGMRLNTIDGIYPVDVSLIVRHLLGLASALVCLVVYVRTHGRPIVSASRARIAAAGVAFSAALAMRYSASLFPAAPDGLVLAGRLLEECLGVLLVFAWAERILPRGMRTTLAIVATAIAVFACVQVGLTFLQRVPCMVVLVALPLASAGLLVRDLSAARPPATDSGDAARGRIPIDLGRTSALALYIGILVAFIFVHGRVLQPTLGTQNQDLWPQLAIAFGNGITGVVLLTLFDRFDGVRSQTKFAFTLLFLVMFALTTASFALVGSSNTMAVAANLTLVACSMQLTVFLTWLMAFARPRPGWSPVSMIALGYACSFFARALSSGLMYAHKVAPVVPDGTLAGIVLIAALGLCVAFVVRVEDGAGADAETLSAIGVSQRGGSSTGKSAPHAETPFKTTVAEMARLYGLTAQEGRVLAEVAKGRNAQAVADELGVSLNTAKSHMRALYAKLDVHSQQDVIRLVDDAMARARQGGAV